MISRRTQDIFSSWHDGEPERGEVRLSASWAPRYARAGTASLLRYFSPKWSHRVRSPQNDVPATYEHAFEGAPATVWVPDDSGRRLSLPSDVAHLGYALLLETEEGQSWRWANGRAALVATSRSCFAIVTSARHVPLVVTGTRVTPDGIDDR